VKKLLITLLKLSISIAILAYLVHEARKGDAFTVLRDEPKRWNMLVVAWGFCMAAVLTTIVRWHFLVRALGVPARLSNTLRIGFLGYMFNLAPLGILGGDAVKALMLAHDYEHSRIQAIASVVVDRLIGLYMVFVVASAAIVATRFWEIDDPMIAAVCSATFWVTGIGAVGFGLLMIPAFLDGRLVRGAERLPKVGRHVKSLSDAMRMYRRRPDVLLLAAVLSVGVHGFFAVGIYFVARGLPGNYHSLGSHFVISPLSAATGAIPLPLGPYEYVLDSLYALMPIAGTPIPKGRGLVVALGYRLITILIAAVGACYYVGARREVAEVFKDSDPDESAPNTSPKRERG